jgi:hypothetical protein
MSLDAEIKLKAKRLFSITMVSIFESLEGRDLLISTPFNIHTNVFNKVTSPLARGEIYNTIIDEHLAPIIGFALSKNIKYVHYRFTSFDTPNTDLLIYLRMSSRDTAILSYIHNILLNKRFPEEEDLNNIMKEVDLPVDGITCLDNLFEICSRVRQSAFAATKLFTSPNFFKGFVDDSQFNGSDIIAI